jgi:hypothetical protein
MSRHEVRLFRAESEPLLDMVDEQLDLENLTASNDIAQALADIASVCAIVCRACGMSTEEAVDLFAEAMATASEARRFDA